MCLTVVAVCTLSPQTGERCMTEVNATAEGMACYIMKGPADIKQYVGVCFATEWNHAR